MEIRGARGDAVCRGIVCAVLGVLVRGVVYCIVGLWVNYGFVGEAVNSLFWFKVGSCRLGHFHL